MRLRLASIRRLPPPRPPANLRRKRWLPPTLTVAEIDAGPGSEWMVVYRIETTDGNGDPVTLWPATRTMITSESDTPADQTFEPVLAKGAAGSYRMQLFSGTAREAGVVAASGGQFALMNADGEYDEWVQYLTDGSRVTCYLGKHGDPFPAAWRKVFVSYIDGFPIIDRERMTLRLRGRERLFERDCQPLGYTGSTGSVGSITLEETGIAGNARRPLVMGTPPSWKPVLINATEKIWDICGMAVFGTPSLYDGGVALQVSVSAFGSDQPGTYQILENGAGVFAHLTSQIRYELRAEGTGRYATPTASERAWTVCDVAMQAGVAADPTSLPTGSENFSAGNRVVQTEKVRDVLADVARYECAAIGLDRLDRFFARRLVPSFDGSAVHTFRDAGSYSDGNIDGLRFSRLRGAERRVHRVTVHAGRSQRSALAGVVDDAVRDRLSRDPYQVNFTAECLYTSLFGQRRILDVDPTAEAVEVQIVGHQFASEADMIAYALRYLRLYGSRSVAAEFETELDHDTLAIEVCDIVDIESARFGGDRSAVVIGYDVDLNTRRVRFEVWSHDELGTVLGTAAPTETEIVITQEDTAEGAGGGGAGSGVAGRGDAALQLLHEFVLLGDKTTALAVGESTVDFLFPFAGELVAVYGGATTAQTSGSILTLDMRINTVSVFSTLITVDNNERSSHTAATPPVLSAPSFEQGDRATFHITQVGTGGKGAWVDFVYVPRSV
ncbi:MAG: hypothetical protein JNN18_13045 [Rubrivivax sp.]|nr:hypothetical protein [Rubrivivax sp.]